MKKFITVGSVMDSTSDKKEVDSRIKVFDFSVTEIVRDGKTITVSFPDEGKPVG